MPQNIAGEYNDGGKLFSKGKFEYAIYPEKYPLRL
jgi:hypothetical protein